MCSYSCICIYIYMYGDTKPSRVVTGYYPYLHPWWGLFVIACFESSPPSGMVALTMSLAMVL